jgi:hypothetical protein
VTQLSSSSRDLKFESPLASMTVCTKECVSSSESMFWTSLRRTLSQPYRGSFTLQLAPQSSSWGSSQRKSRIYAWFSKSFGLPMKTLSHGTTRSDMTPLKITRKVNNHLHIMKSIWSVTMSTVRLNVPSRSFRFSTFFSPNVDERHVIKPRC